MTLVEDAIKLVLIADVPLMALLDGGLITWDDTGRNGIGLISTPSLFVNGFLATALVLKEETEGVFVGIRDRAAKARSTQTRIQLWFVQDGDDGYNDLETARDRVYELLDESILTGFGTIKWVANGGNIKDSSLDNASVLRSDYNLVRVRE